MAGVSVTNEPDDIIDELVATLAGGTWDDGDVSVFEFVEKTKSVQMFKDTRLTDSPVAAVAFDGGIEEYDITDNRRGCVLSLTIFVKSMEESESGRVTDATKLLAAVKNLINADVPTDAEAFYHDDSGEIIPRIEWGEPETDTESNVPWQYTELSLRVAYVAAGETSH